MAESGVGPLGPGHGLWLHLFLDPWAANCAYPARCLVISFVTVEAVKGTSDLCFSLAL